MADATQDEIDAPYHEAAHAVAHIEIGYPLERVRVLKRELFVADVERLLGC